jgi:hypothetical protein
MGTKSLYQSSDSLLQREKIDSHEHNKRIEALQAQLIEAQRLV